MDSQKLSEIITKLLQKSGKAPLPYFGTIELRDIPAYFSNNGKTISPPSKALVFNSLVASSADDLAKEYSEAYSVDILQAKSEVSELVNQIRKTVVKEGSYTLPNLGKFTYSDNHDFGFEKDESFVVSEDTFGLEVLNLEDDSVSGGGVDSSTQEDIVQKSVIQDDAVQKEAVQESEPQEGVAHEEVVQEAELQDETVEESVSHEDASKEETAQEPLTQDDAAQDNIVQEPEMQEDTVREDVYHGEVSHEDTALDETVQEADQQGDAGQADEAQDDTVQTTLTAKILLWVIAVIVALIVIMLLIYLFRESLTPLLQKLLYTKEELEIINYKL